MVNNLLQRDKRGVSEVLGYVLLIVVAIGISVAVFSYLRNSIPEDKPVCQDDVSLIVSNVSCANSVLDITIENKGLFTVEGIYIKSGSVDRVYKTTLNCPSQSDCNLSFGGSTLKPGDSWNAKYTNANLTGDQEIEIQPLKFVEGVGVLCDRAIVKQKVTCTLPGGS